MRTLLFCFALLFASFADAYPNNIDPLFAKDSNTCGGYEIYHINGILTDQAGAAANLQTLINRYGNSYKEHTITYALGYNQTVDWDNDLMDSYKKVLLSFPGTTMEEYVRAVVLGVYPSRLLTASIVAMLAGKWAQIMNVDRPSPYQDTDLTNIVNAIYGRHQKNGRVLLIPHSQGTLYAQLVYDRLLKPYPVPGMQIQAKALNVMAIASAVAGATGPTRGNPGLHVTNTNDLVINSVRAFSPTTLAANTTVAINGLGHNFQGVYMNWPYLPNTATNKILANMTTSLNALRSTQIQTYGMWLISHATFVRCGKAPWPYGTGVEPITEIQCPITLGQYPNYTNIYSEDDYVQYTVAGDGTGYKYIIPGIASQALPLATTQVKACYTTFIADRKERLRAGATLYSTPKLLPGCGYGYPSQEPYGNSRAAWNLYSGDLAPYVFPTFHPDVKSDMYRAELKPLCKT